MSGFVTWFKDKFTADGKTVGPQALGPIFLTDQGLVMQASDGSLWQLTVETNGQLTTTAYTGTL